MTRLVLAMIRIVALALSFSLSTMAAAAFVTFSLFLGGETEWLRNDAEVALGSVGFTFAVWFEIGRALFAPFLFLVVIAEPLRCSGFVINVVAGGVLATIYMVLTPYGFDLPYSQQEIWLAALSAGFVGGFTHWLLAGHRAGRWLGPQRNSANQIQS